MPNSERAKQFMPFDALKGLREALRMKEYKHEKIQMGDLPEEKIEEISKVLLSLKKGDRVKTEIFDDGYIITIEGFVILKFEEQKIIIDKKIIQFENIRNITKL